jgi:sugar lactone lactonase YvrE
MRHTRRRLLWSAIALVALMATTTAGVSAESEREGPTATRLVTGMESGSGSTVGPDGALYVTEGKAGRVLRVNPRNGDVTTFASGLPRSIIGIGGAMDVAFIGKTAYVLVTLVGPDVGGSDTDGIYRVDGPNSFTVIADIGAFSIAHPPKTDFFIPSGLQYAMERYRGGFLVTDGHHNRVLRVRLSGQISEVMTFANVVPTGLAIRGRKVYVSQAGPVPHEPQNGKIVSFRLKSESPTVHEVASGARLLTDVQFRGGTLYGLSQGVFPAGGQPGSPAMPNTGSLVRVKADGTFKVVVTGLNQPTSLEFIGDTGFVVTLGGEIWKIRDVSDED